jgi:hypothetical protein
MAHALVFLGVGLADCIDHPIAFGRDHRSTDALKPRQIVERDVALFGRIDSPPASDNRNSENETEKERERCAQHGQKSTICGGGATAKTDAGFVTMVK